MGENVTVGRGVLRRAGSFVAGRPTTQKVGGGVAAALLASAPFGGPYEVVIDQVVELPDLAPAVTPTAPQRVVVLDAKVTLTGERPEYAPVLTDHIRISGGGVKVEPKPGLYFVEDATRMSSFNPGLTYRLALTYTTSGPWQGDAVTVTTDLVEFREEDRQTLHPNAWVGRDEIEAQGSVPLVRRS